MLIRQLFGDQQIDGHSSKPAGCLALEVGFGLARWKRICPSIRPSLLPLSPPCSSLPPFIYDRQVI